MPNALFIGTTKCGKTTLAKIIAKQLRAAGKKVALTCTICEKKPAVKKSWPHDIFVPISHLADYVENGPPSYMFLDEASSYLKSSYPEHQELAKYCANFHKYMYVMAQRAKQIPPNTRTQCTALYCFHQLQPNAKIVVEEFGRGLSVERITSLRPGEYYYSRDGFTPAELRRVF